MVLEDVVLHPASLRPPTNRGGPGADPANATTRPGWALLDFSAFVLDRRNSTTATCRFTRGEKEIQLQVTFVAAHPPGVSYFCVYSPDLRPGYYATEPEVLATEAGLVLLRVILGGRSGIWDHNAQEYFVYRAGESPPSLEHIPRPGPYLLRGGDPVGLLDLKRDGDADASGYIIVALGDDASAVYRRGQDESAGRFELCLFDSRVRVWTTKPVDAPRGVVVDRHETSTVLTIGGTRGTMAFVDLCRGILLCDVLAIADDDDPVLRYVPLPENTFGTTPPDYHGDDPQNLRDVAVVDDGRVIRYVETTEGGLHDRPMMIATYSMPVAVTSSSSQPDDDNEDTAAAAYCWRQDFVFDVASIRDDRNVLSPEVQRMLRYDERILARPEVPAMESLCTGHPTLSLHDEGTVYFMTKVRPMSRKACVIAVNMREMTVQAVARFVSARTRGINFAYIRSRISSYLNMAPEGAKNGGLKKKKSKGTKVMEFGLCTSRF